jgi:hypothetical protein
MTDPVPEITRIQVQPDKCMRNIGSDKQKRRASPNSTIVYITGVRGENIPRSIDERDCCECQRDVRIGTLTAPDQSATIVPQVVNCDVSCLAFCIRPGKTAAVLTDVNGVCLIIR